VGWSWTEPLWCRLLTLPGPAISDLGTRSTLGLNAIALRWFYVGPENSLVGSTLQRILGNDALLSNPLLLLGPPGVGKSHVAWGLARKLENDCHVECFSGSQFARDYAQAVASDRVATWREKCRQADLLVIDELGPLAKKPAAQRELLGTLDAHRDRGSLMVVTSRAAPRAIEGLLPAISSRLLAGLVLSLAAPAAGSRLAVIKEVAATRGIALSARAAEALADGIAATVPVLVQQLLELSAHDPVVDVGMVKRFLAERSAQKKNRVSLPVIIAATARHYLLTPGELKGENRSRSVAAARGVAMYLSRLLTSQSLEKIGTALGGRDHTTVLYNFRKIEKLIETDAETRSAVSQLKQKLEHS